MHQEKLEARRPKDAFEGTRRLVVLCDPLAHHSSLLPFRELTRRFAHASTEPVFEDSIVTRGGRQEGVEIEAALKRSLHLEAQEHEI